MTGQLYTQPTTTHRLQVLLTLLLTRQRCYYTIIVMLNIILWNFCGICIFLSLGKNSLPAVTGAKMDVRKVQRTFSPRYLMLSIQQSTPIGMNMLRSIHRVNQCCVFL